MPTIQRVTAYASPALRRDFISTLPHELAVQVLRSVDAKSLTRAARVNKKWKRMIDTERSVWKQRLIDDDLYHGQGVEEEEEAMVRRRYDILDEQAKIRPIKVSTPDEDGDSDDEEMMYGSGPATSKSLPMSASPTSEAGRPVPLKHVYRRRHTSNKNWFDKRPMHNSFPGHGTNVVTCLQFDRDKIVSASDDHSINVYTTTTGQLLKRLDGHEGGVWALQYLGDTLVSGSTDRTLRIWDLETLQQTHVFHGHASTVRCLQIVEPVFDAESGEYLPPYPVVITGSRDFTLRVWKLPKKGEPAKHKWVSSDFDSHE
jgi:F-box and WD-40 domain protein CDC4